MNKKKTILVAVWPSMDDISASAFSWAQSVKARSFRESPAFNGRRLSSVRVGKHNGDMDGPRRQSRQSNIHGNPPHHSEEQQAAPTWLLIRSECRQP